MACAAQPYLRVALQALRPVEAPGVITMGVTRQWLLLWDPGFVSCHSASVVAAALLHEAWHCLRKHASRFDASGFDDSAHWNFSADLEINDDLRVLPNGLRLPEWALDPKNYDLPDGLLAETYYGMLPSSREGGGQGSSGGSSPESPTSPGGVGSSSGPSGTTHADAAGGSFQVAAGSCGSGGDGIGTEVEKKALASAGAEGRLPTGVSAGEAQVIQRRVAEEVSRHAREKGIGSVPAGIQRWAEGVLKSAKIPWNRRFAMLLRGALRKAGGVDYTYSRPSRRQSACHDVVFPALRAPKPEVAVVVDTSGSMSDADLLAALAEVRGVLRAVDVSARLISCDAAVGLVREVFTAEQARRSLVGGGGTDMGAGLRAAARLWPRPEVVVVMTDGATPWPAQPTPRGAKVIAALVSGPIPAPAWVEAVVVERDEPVPR